MLASELIRRSLRLINVPGRGGTLSGADQSQAFDALQDLLADQAVSRNFTPGIRRHFFALTPAQAIYSYGRAGELDTNGFNDPPPIVIEDAQVRAGGSLTDNEQVENSDFRTASGWTVGAWLIANLEAAIAAGNGGSVLEQTLALVAGTTYTLTLELDHQAGSVDVAVNQDGSPIVDENLAGAGTYSFEFTFAGSASEITFTPDATAALQLSKVSIIETGKDRYSLGTAGSDYPVRVIDQRRYNRNFSKGDSGRPTELLYSRGYPLAELRFDLAPASAEILVLDVLCDRVKPERVSDELRLHDNEVRWVKLALANELAPEYGKQLRPSQLRALSDAKSNMLAGGKRKRMLRVDSALQQRRRYNINHGDP